MIWTTASTQTASNTLKIVALAVNAVHRQSTAQNTELHEDEQTCLLRCVVHSTEQLCLPHHLQWQPIAPPTPLCPPQLVPLTPIKHLEPPGETMRCYTMTPAPQLLPLPEYDPTFTKRKKEKGDTTSLNCQQPLDLLHRPLQCPKDIHNPAKPIAGIHAHVFVKTHCPLNNTTLPAPPVPMTTYTSSNGTMFPHA
ncbi:hypothetical protein L208DRAFT_1411012, partial [Tricholoma matsutake]